ncbi:MAG: hypothetical protein HDQ97_05955 [Lachnospiraceae bacterium]|nr:hypothetical protein [Lachnospiraceae bacterium]
MKVSDIINRIQDIDLAITKVSEETEPLSDSDRKHIVMFLTDYKECLKSRKVMGEFDKNE